MKKKPVRLSLTHALAWIVGSTLFFSGGFYTLMKRYLNDRSSQAFDPQFTLSSIVQTGPQRQALKTEYLAELLGLSSDRLCNARRFNLVKARQQLLRSPLICHAHVELMVPNTLYVDYTVRQPVAWLEDYENIVLDREGFPFPFAPFFSPKNLPSIYLGVGPFGIPSSDPQRNCVRWGESLRNKYFDLAMDIYHIVTDPKVADLFFVKRIDVSNAFAESYGSREVVVVMEDTLIQSVNGKEIQVGVPRILRLSTIGYAQGLGNYLKLREQLLEEERKLVFTEQSSARPIRLKEKIIDFRIQKLAFIESKA